MSYTGKFTVLDIETCPETGEVLDRLMPEFEAPGNYKDPEKIAANIADQKSKWKERSALSPISGKVLAVGFKIPGLSGEKDFGVIEGDEEDLLGQFSDWICSGLKEGHCFVGWSIFQFDLPFLRKRMWKYGIKPFLSTSFDPYRQDSFIDLQTIWDGRSKDYTSLDAAAKFLGVGAKTGNGADFSKWWAEDRARALSYLEADLTLTHAVGHKMGVIG